MRQIFDAVNGAWMACDICLVIILLRFIIQEWAKRRFDRVRIQAAIALSLYFAGAAIWHGMTWWFRSSIDPNLPHVAYSILVISGAPAAFGALYSIRIFTPTACGPRSWMAAAAASIFLAAISIYLT